MEEAQITQSYLPRDPPRRRLFGQKTLRPSLHSIRTAHLIHNPGDHAPIHNARRRA